MNSKNRIENRKRIEEIKRAYAAAAEIKTTTQQKKAADENDRQATDKR